MPRTLRRTSLIPPNSFTHAKQPRHDGDRLAIARPDFHVHGFRRRNHDVGVLKPRHQEVSLRAARDATVFKSPPRSSIRTWKRQSMINSPTTYAVRLTTKMIEKISG